jgi:hypothetical protein
MAPIRFTDSQGRLWRVYDFRTVDGHKHALPINDPLSEARAFVSPDRATILVYAFGAVAFRETEPRSLEDQLHFAKPLFESAAQRMTRS